MENQPMIVPPMWNDFRNQIQATNYEQQYCTCCRYNLWIIEFSVKQNGEYYKTCDTCRVRFFNKKT